MKNPLHAGKYVICFMMLLCSVAGSAQTTISNDSLQRYCQRLEKNEKIMINYMHQSGRDLNTGAGLLGGGLLGAVAAGVIAGLSPAHVDLTTGKSTISGGQIAALIIGTMSISVTIVGITKIGEAGKRLHQL